MQNVRRLCESSFPGDGAHELEIVDVRIQPAAAEDARILVTPTLIRHDGEHSLRVTGDCSDAERVLRALGF